MTLLNYVNIIEQGFIIFFDEEQILHVTSAESLQEIITLKKKSGGNFVLLNSDSILLEDEKKITTISFTPFSVIDTGIITNLERIRPVSKEYSIATSFSGFDRTYTTELYLNKTGIKLWQVTNSVGFSDLFSSVLLFSNTDRNAIARIDLESGKELWRIPLVQKTNFARQIPILCKDILVIPYDQKKLKAVHADTGEVQWEIEDCFASYELDPLSGLLVSLQGRNYQVIDPANGKKLIEKTFSQLENRWVAASSRLCRLHEGALYFTNAQDGIQLGKINLSTHELEYYETISTEKVRNVFAPNFYQNKIFIRDSNFVMHVFERK